MKSATGLPDGTCTAKWQGHPSRRVLKPENFTSKIRAHEPKARNSRTRCHRDGNSNECASPKWERVFESLESARRRNL